MQFYLVGGAVRDKLLGLPITERDWVVVGATPEQMTKRGFLQVGKDFPVFLHPQTKEEYALARTERKTARGYTGFQIHADADVTLEQDLARRDLTINAIAEAPDGTLIDPFNGQQDLQNRVLRHVSAAFVEDPVRILRIARFAARFGHWGFHVAHDTHALMCDMVTNGEVDALVPERVWKELERALGEAQAEKFFRVLHACGALVRIFPELVSIFGPHQTHLEATIPALHSLQRAVASNAPSSLRCAGFLAHLSELEDGMKQVHNFCTRLHVPNEYRELAELAVRYRNTCQSLPNEAEDLLAFMEGCDAFRRGKRFAMFIELCTILNNDANVSKHLQEMYHQTASLNAASLIAQGWGGRELGEQLRRLRLDALAVAIQRQNLV